MTKDDTKDRRINIRLDEDTYFAIKKIVEKDLKTDISSYCRSLLWISTLHDAAVHRIRNAIKRFGTDTDTENMEYMLKIRNEILFIEQFLAKAREDRKKYDEFIAMVEKRHDTIRDEARKYFTRYNEIIDLWDREARDMYGEEYETNPTMDRWGRKIEL